MRVHSYYSQLPRRLNTTDDWCRISIIDARADSELDFFVSALAFVNGVAQVCRARGLN